MRKNSIKNTRINGEVQKELSTIIRNEIKDPRIHPVSYTHLAVYKRQTGGNPYLPANREAKRVLRDFDRI